MDKVKPFQAFYLLLNSNWLCGVLQKVPPVDRHSTYLRPRQTQVYQPLLQYLRSQIT